MTQNTLRENKSLFLK